MASNPIKKLLSEAFWSAVKSDDVQAAAELKKNPEPLELDIVNGWTVLHEAAARGHVAMTRFLLSFPEYARLVTERSTQETSMCSIQLAISNGHVETFKLLWAQLESTGERESWLQGHASLDRYGWSILGWAVHSGEIAAVDHILSLKLPELDIHSETPPVITAALTKGNIPLIRHLIDLGANPNQHSERHHNPLISAVRRGLLDVTKTLVEYGKADVELRDSRGNTAMDVAEKCGQYECAAYLRSVRIKLGLVSPTETSHKDFTIQMTWYRPRLLGSIVSPRTFPSALIINNTLYLGGGQGLSEGQVNPMPDNYNSSSNLEELPLALYTAELPARDEPMLPLEAPPVHLSLSHAYSTQVSKNPVAATSSSQQFRSGIRSTTAQATQSSSQQCWSTAWGSDLIHIDEGTRLEASYVPTQVASPSVAFAQKPLPISLSFPYFEVTMLELGQYGYIAVGISQISDDIDQHLGWTKSAYGMHGDIGCIFHSSSTGAAFSPRFQKGDVIGCGLDVQRRELFYTRNGQYLGTSHQGVDLALDWYPAISMQSPGEKIRANFGQEPFWFDFVAPTLRFNPLNAHPEIWTAYNGRLILTKAPAANCASRVCAVHLRGRAVHYLEPPSVAGTLTSEELDSKDALAASNSPSWRTVQLTADPNQAQPFWHSLPFNVSEDHLHLYTEEYLFVVTQRGDSATQKVVIHFWALEWATHTVYRVDLPALSPPARGDQGIPRVEVHFDETVLASWTYNNQQVHTVAVSDLLDLIKKRVSHKDPSPDWTVHTPHGAHPLSSRLTPTPLGTNQGMMFGGFEETAAQNTVQLLDCSSGVPTWSRPRTEGTIPRARFFTTTIIQHDGSGNNATESAVSVLNVPSAATAAVSFPPHLKGDGHDHTLYVVGGWNGWAAVGDMDIAHIRIPKNSLEETLSGLNDFTITCHDGTVLHTSKILLYCRSSYFRTFFRSHTNQDGISLADSLPSTPVTGAHMRALLSYFTRDTLQTTTLNTGPIQPLLQVVEAICPEHAGRIHDELFSGRITHNSTLSEDWLRSQAPDCVIPPDVQFLAKIEPTTTMMDEDKQKQPLLAHSFIAALGSSFFKAIIAGDYQESRIMENGLRMVQLQTDYELAKMLIPGLISGSVDLELVGDRIIDLFELAHSLQVLQLIEFLETVLSSNIDEDNISMLEAVAADHNSIKLREACSDFRISEKALASSSGN